MSKLGILLVVCILVIPLTTLFTVGACLLGVI